MTRGISRYEKNGQFRTTCRVGIHSLGAQDNEDSSFGTKQKSQSRFTDWKGRTRSSAGVECQEAFGTLKTNTNNAPILAYPGSDSRAARCRTTLSAIRE